MTLDNRGNLVNNNPRGQIKIKRSRPQMFTLVVTMRGIREQSLPIQSRHQRAFSRDMLIRGVSAADRREWLAS
jgi:hypothetical protein